MEPGWRAGAGRSRLGPDRGHNARVRPTRSLCIVGLVLVLAAGLGACTRGGGNDNATPAEFCRLVEEQDARLTDLAGTRAALEQAAVTVKALVDAAPDEIRDDVDLLADGYAKASNGEFLALASKMGQLEAAAKHLVKYTQDTCNFDLNAR